MFGRMRWVTAAGAIGAVVALAGASGASALNVGTVGTPIGSTGTMGIGMSAGASRIVVNTSVPLNCSNTTATSNVSTGPYGSPPVTIGTVQPIFQGPSPSPFLCVGPAGLLFSASCFASANFEILANPSGGTSAGRISNISCAITFPALGCSAVMAGSVGIGYTNPTVSVAAQLTVNLTGQALTISSSSCPAAVLPNGTARLGAPVGTGTGQASLPYTLIGPASSHPFISP